MQSQGLYFPNETHSIVVSLIGTGESRLQQFLKRSKNQSEFYEPYSMARYAFKTVM